MQVVIDVPGTFVNDTLMRCTSPAISNLCTKSTYCDGQNEADPRWRGCIKWKTCPFFAQCEVPSPACGCPDGPNCLQREDPEGGEEVLLSLTATAADGAPLAAWAHERVTLGSGFLSRRVEELITAHMPPGSVCPAPCASRSGGARVADSPPGPPDA